MMGFLIYQTLASILFQAYQKRQCLFTLCWLLLISEGNIQLVQFSVGNSSPSHHGHARIRFDFYDAMHHRMLRTMYCKLSRCQVCPRVGSHWEAGRSLECHAAQVGVAIQKNPAMNET